MQFAPEVTGGWITSHHVATETNVTSIHGVQHCAVQVHSIALCTAVQVT